VGGSFPDAAHGSFFESCLRVCACTRRFARNCEPIGRAAPRSAERERERERGSERVGVLIDNPTADERRDAGSKATFDNVAERVCELGKNVEIRGRRACLSELALTRIGMQLTKFKHRKLGNGIPDTRMPITRTCPFPFLSSSPSVAFFTDFYWSHDQLEPRQTCRKTCRTMMRVDRCRCTLDTSEAVSARCNERSRSFSCAFSQISVFLED